MPLRYGLSVCLGLALFGTTAVAGATVQRVSFEQSAKEIDAYDFVEVTLKVRGPTAKNPFQDAVATGQFEREKGPPWKVEGLPSGTKERQRWMK